MIAVSPLELLWFRDFKEFKSYFELQLD